MNTTKKLPILPIEAYFSQEWFEKEQKYIFSRTWQFAGLLEDVAKPGDYITVQAGLNNILVLRGKDNHLRAFHNICRHRGTQLMGTAGQVNKVITCPYHSWTYTLEGELVGLADQKTQFPDLDRKKLCLHRASVEIWRGMIFVHPSPEAGSLMTWLAGIQEYLGPHQPEKLVEYEGSKTSHEINANWKIVVENYIDGYHLGHLHSETLFMYDHRQQQSALPNIR